MLTSPKKKKCKYTKYYNFFVLTKENKKKKID